MADDFDSLVIPTDELDFTLTEGDGDVGAAGDSLDAAFDAIAAESAEGAANPAKIYLGQGSAGGMTALGMGGGAEDAAFAEVGATLDLLDLTLDEAEPLGRSSPPPDDPALAALRQGYIDRIDALTQTLATDSDKLIRGDPSLGKKAGTTPVAATIQSIAAMAKEGSPSANKTPTRPAGPAPPTTANLTADQRRALATSLTKALAEMREKLQRVRDDAVAVAGDDALTAIMGVAYPLTTAQPALHALRAEVDGRPVTAERGLPKVDIRDAGAAKRSLGLLLQAIDRLLDETAKHLKAVEGDSVRLLRLGRLVSAARRALASRV
jgi:hypothetical protein